MPPPICMNLHKPLWSMIVQSRPKRNIQTIIYCSTSQSFSYHIFLFPFVWFPNNGLCTIRLHQKPLIKDENNKASLTKYTKHAQLTTFIKDVMFHKAYSRASPADRLGPWLNRALMPAGNGDKIPKGRTNKTRKKSNREIEYSWSRVSNTKLKSARRSIEITKPTRSCKYTKMKNTCITTKTILQNLIKT